MMDSGNVRTVETQVARIKFTGAADSDSSSDESYESGPEDLQENGGDTAINLHNGTTIKQLPCSDTTNNNIHVQQKVTNSCAPSENCSTNDSSQNTSSHSHRPKDYAVTPFGQHNCDTGRLTDSDMCQLVDNTESGGRLVDKSDLVHNERFNPFDKDSTSSVSDNIFPQLNEQNTHRNNQQVRSKTKGQVQSMSVSSGESFTESSELLSPSDESDLVTNTELGLAEDHFSQPDGHFGMSTTEEIQMAIQNCKHLIFEATVGTDRHKNLVQKLVTLRLKIQEIQEEPPEVREETKMVVGHKFMAQSSGSSKHYCEKCNTVIWGMIQGWYKCDECGFCSHDKCLNLITRTCASAKVAESPEYIIDICPEKGLAAQNFRCAECRQNLSYLSGFSEPRQCDYTGGYYCSNCHWNDTIVIPARVLHNWDFELRKVCRASKQFLKLMQRKAVLRLPDINPMLFNFVSELSDTKKYREEILIMKRYFLSCQEALKSKLLLQLQDRQHFVEDSDMYSMQDLIDIAEETLMPHLAKIHASFATHIKADCQLCQGKGYICELCDYQEVLFPFDNHAIVCAKCSTVLHRHCYMRRNHVCPKCERIQKRHQADTPTSS